SPCVLCVLCGALFRFWFLLRVPSGEIFWFRSLPLRPRRCALPVLVSSPRPQRSDPLVPMSPPASSASPAVGSSGSGFFSSCPALLRVPIGHLFCFRFLPLRPLRCALPVLVSPPRPPRSARLFPVFPPASSASPAVRSSGSGFFSASPAVRSEGPRHRDFLRGLCDTGCPSNPRWVHPQARASGVFRSMLSRFSLSRLLLLLLIATNSAGVRGEEVDGIAPRDRDGRRLNLDFEFGTLDDWTATGNAFDRQPIWGDTVRRRRQDMRAQLEGERWVGT